MSALSLCIFTFVDEFIVGSIAFFSSVMIPGDGVMVSWSDLYF